nr:DUF2950 family protein [Sinorhizobium medicae]
MAGEIRRHGSEDLRGQSQRNCIRGGSRRGYRKDCRRHPHVVYEADLGGDTEKTAVDIRTFNPGDQWMVVPD